MNNLIARSLASAATVMVLAGGARAELLDPSQFKGCEMHVAGVYMPENNHVDDRIFVKVMPTDAPIVLVLCGYMETQWNLEVVEGAEIRQVIVSGYYEHSVVGVPDGVPTEIRTYFPKADKSNDDYFWAYGWHTADGRKLRRHLDELTDLKIDTFQDCLVDLRFVFSTDFRRIFDQFNFQQRRRRTHTRVT